MLRRSLGYGAGLLALALLLGAAGCGNTADKLFAYDVTPAQLAKADEVQGCRDLGEVRGYAQTTKSGNLPLARLTAHDDMLDQAGRLGADRVVFQQYLGGRRAVAVGRAYKCK